MYDNTLLNAVIEVIEGCSNTKKNLCISATGAHGLVTAYNDVKFKEVLDHFFINLPDGMPGVWVGRLKGAKNMSRCYGPEFFEDILSKSTKYKINHFFCGRSEE